MSEPAAASAPAQSAEPDPRALYEKYRGLVSESRFWLDTHPNTHSARRSDVRKLGDALEACLMDLGMTMSAGRGRRP